MRGAGVAAEAGVAGKLDPDTDVYIVGACVRPGDTRSHSAAGSVPHAPGSQENHICVRGCCPQLLHAAIVCLLDRRNDLRRGTCRQGGPLLAPSCRAHCRGGRDPRRWGIPSHRLPMLSIRWRSTAARFSTCSVHWNHGGEDTVLAAKAVEMQGNGSGLVAK